MTPETVRRGAIEALGEFGDERALRLLESAHIELDDGETSWEGSVGSVRAHRVRLLVDGAALAHMQRMPAVSDAVTAALAVAVAAEPGHALLAVDAVWGLNPTRTAAYRSGPWRTVSRDDLGALRDATVAYLEASDAPEAARRISEGRIALVAGRRGRREVAVELRAVEPEERRAIAAALAALLGASDQVHIRVA